MKRYVFTVFSILLSFSLVAFSSLSQEEVVQENEVEEVIEESDSLSESSKILKMQQSWLTGSRIIFNKSRGSVFK